MSEFDRDHPERCVNVPVEVFDAAASDRRAREQERAEVQHPAGHLDRLFAPYGYGLEPTTRTRHPHHLTIQQGAESPLRLWAVTCASCGPVGTRVTWPAACSMGRWHYAQHRISVMLENIGRAVRG